MTAPNSHWEKFAKSIPERFAKFDIHEPTPDVLSYQPDEDHYLQSLKLWRLLATQLAASGQQTDLGFGPFITSLSTGQINLALSAFTDEPTPHSEAIKGEVNNLVRDYFAASAFPNTPAPQAVANAHLPPASKLLSFSEVMARVTAIANEHETTAINGESQFAAVQRAAEAIDASGLVTDRQEVAPTPAASFSELMATVAAAALLNTNNLKDHLSVNSTVGTVTTNELAQPKHVDQRVTGPRI